MRAQNTKHLLILLVISLLVENVTRTKLSTGPLPVAVGIAMLIQSIYGSKGIVDTPLIIDETFDHPLARFMLLVLMMYGVTRNPVSAVAVVVVFLVILQLMRNKEERREHPYII
jgi:hypothetical protein